jgi:hypothetical protein
VQTTVRLFRLGRESRRKVSTLSVRSVWWMERVRSVEAWVSIVDGHFGRRGREMDRGGADDGRELKKVVIDFSFLCASRSFKVLVPVVRVAGHAEFDVLQHGQLRSELGGKRN